jgi:hypothetical protein
MDHARIVNMTRPWGLLPAVAVGVFAGVVVLLSLPFGAERREYALALVDRYKDLAMGLMGMRATGDRRLSS